jgi:amino acid transporter
MRRSFLSRVNNFFPSHLSSANPDAGMINTFGVRILKYLNNVSVWWHALGTTSLIIAILAAAPKHQSDKFVFRTFIDGTGVDGIGWSQRASPAYVALIGILMAQYTLTGRTTSLFLALRFPNLQVLMRAHI